MSFTSAPFSLRKVAPQFCGENNFSLNRRNASLNGGRACHSFHLEHFASRHEERSAMGTCAECDRLWQDYSEAMKAHLKIDGQRQIALIRQGSRELAKLNQLP